MTKTVLRLALAALCLELLALVPNPTQADELDQLQAARERAEMKYVKELGTGKYKTPAQQSALKQEVLAPAEKNVADYFKKISQLPKPRKVTAKDLDLSQVPKVDLMPYLKGKTKDVHLPSLPGARNISSKDAKSSSSSGKLSDHAIPSSGGRVLRPQFVLDGSKIPKEIDFEPAHHDSSSSKSRKKHH